MAEKLLMLALSPTMETGIIAKWIKSEGESYKSGDVLCEIETDKATMEYEASGDGVILKIIAAEGQNATVGDPIAITGEAGEDISGLLSDIASPKASRQNTAAAETGAPLPESPLEQQESNSNISTQAPDPENTQTSGQLRSSPLARKLASQAGISIEGIKGSGPKGRVVKRDVENAQAARTVAEASVSNAIKTAPSSGENDEILPVSGKRRVIAQRLSESKFSAPHYYLKLKAAMDGVLQARKQLAATTGEKISINTYLIKLTAEALKKHPVINSTWNGSTITRHNRIDIGLAVAQKDGLITPVIKDCGNKGMLQIESELQALIEKARNDALKPDEYTGATFTISNLGSYGIEEFTAIINPPGSAILAVGAIVKEQAVNPDDSISVKSNMKLTLSCDHRVIDGAVGAAFLSELKRLIEEPVRALY